jgi:hypothetical protein
VGRAVGLEGLAQGAVRQMGCCMAWAVDCSRASFALGISIVLRCKRKCNLIYGRFKGAAFPAPIFAKLANSQQHHVRTPYAEFHPHRAITVESASINFFTHQHKSRFSLCLISRNSLSLNRILLAFSAPKFMDIGRKM